MGNEFINKIRRLSQDPPFIILQTILNKIPFHPFQVGHFFLLSYSGIPSDITIRGRGEFKRGTLEDLYNMAKLEDKQELFLNRFNRGYYCCVAEVDGKIVGYEWFSDKSFHLEERYFYRITIPSDSIYAYDAYILPEYRISGLWLKFKRYLASLMKELDKNRIITMIDYGNDLSMNTHLRFGFKIFKSVFVINLFGKSFFIEKGMN